MVTFLNGHADPEKRHFWRERGAAIVAPFASVSKPSEAEIAAPTRHHFQTGLLYRKTWVGVVAGVVAVLLMAGVMPRATATTAYDEWWSRASVHWQEGGRALEALGRAIDALDLAGARAACQQLHDADTVGLQADMPTPDPNLTAAVQAMIDDIDTGSHICMSLGPNTTQSDIDRLTLSFTDATAHYNTAQGILAQHGIQA